MESDGIAAAAGTGQRPTDGSSFTTKTGIGPQSAVSAIPASLDPLLKLPDSIATGSPATSLELWTSRPDVSSEPAVTFLTVGRAAPTGQGSEVAASLPSSGFSESKPSDMAVQTTQDPAGKSQNNRVNEGQLELEIVIPIGIGIALLLVFLFCYVCPKMKDAKEQKREPKSLPHEPTQNVTQSTPDLPPPNLTSISVSDYGLIIPGTVTSEGREVTLSFADTEDPPPPYSPPTVSNTHSGGPSADPTRQGELSEANLALHRQRETNYLFRHRDDAALSGTCELESEHTDQDIDDLSVVSNLSYMGGRTTSITNEAM
ncbi:MAG: hypothetical protein M1837_006956 [Sclerophora amabilis]|nr:MAG: hypothetical protein M1837_006956 [Sclerophora amabilis]